MRIFILSFWLVTLFTSVMTIASSKLSEVASIEGITEYVLDNGLKVLLFPDDSSPTITVNITYLVGSRHEGYGETGMAHLLEHLIFKGTPSHPDIPKELTERGAVTFKHIYGDGNPADIMTKLVTKKLFLRFSDFILNAGADTGFMSALGN